MSWILIYISMGVIGLYAFYGIFIFLGFYITPARRKKEVAPKFISIIVPFRNEEKNLPALIESFKKLHYPNGQYEIIFVNDHSTDAGSRIVQESELRNFRLIHSTSEGKKAAIEAGVKEAKGDWIATTDADCLVPPQWLDEINTMDGSMQLGPVQLKGIKSILHYFQEFEWAALQSISAASTFWKMPLMNNGANLAYSKKDFNADALKKETASGDDVFLLEDFKKKKLPIRFSWKVNSLVITKPVDTWRELIQQKIRWASKSKHYSNKSNILLGILIATVNLLVLLSWVNLMLWNASSQFYCMVIMAKMMADITFILPYLILTRRPQLVLLVPFFVFAYPFYFFWVLIFSMSGKYSWKERNYHA
jgi:biofilm PGA synthesis N-glycosyltransferase PgaC